VDRTFEARKYPSVSVSNFQPIYRSICRLAAKGDRRIGIIGGMPRLSTTRERISAYREAIADNGLPQEERLIRVSDSSEEAAQCLDDLLEQGCDGIVVCRNSIAYEAIVYAHRRKLQLTKDFDLVSFVDYDSSMNQLFADQMDCIVQPVEKLGEHAGEMILQRVESPDTPIFEQVLTSVYRPYEAAQK